MRLTTVLLGVTRALAAVKARCSAPPPLRGADGLDAGSAHAASRLLSDDDQFPDARIGGDEPSRNHST